MAGYSSKGNKWCNFAIVRSNCRFCTYLTSEGKDGTLGGWGREKRGKGALAQHCNQCTGQGGKCGPGWFSASLLCKIPRYQQQTWLPHQTWARSWTQVSTSQNDPSICRAILCVWVAKVNSTNWSTPWSLWSLPARSAFPIHCCWAFTCWWNFCKA